MNNETEDNSKDVNEMVDDEEDEKRESEDEVCLKQLGIKILKWIYLFVDIFQKFKDFHTDEMKYYSSFILVVKISFVL